MYAIRSYYVFDFRARLLNLWQHVVAAIFGGAHKPDLRGALRLLRCLVGDVGDAS